MIAYKLFKQRKDGTLGSLYINRKQIIPMNEWLVSENHPTKGYAHRPGWHVTEKPIAPHIKEKNNRVWFKVEIDDFYEFTRPVHQGSKWFIAKQMKVLEQA